MGAAAVHGAGLGVPAGVVERAVRLADDVAGASGELRRNRSAREARRRSVACEARLPSRE